MSPRCEHGVGAEDVAALVLDDEGDDALVAHLGECGTCREVALSLEPVALVSQALRGAAEPAPTDVSERVLRRIRLEASVLLLGATLGGAVARVARAVPDLFASERASGTGAGRRTD